jgi:hypothetical protein
MPACRADKPEIETELSLVRHGKLTRGFKLNLKNFFKREAKRLLKLMEVIE